MSKKVFSVTGHLQLFDTIAPWTYMPIPLSKVPSVLPGGWGSIPLEVTLGKTTWKTSMFPLKKEGYFIPVKKSVLKLENLHVGEEATVRYSAT
jgi:hypothetical protein